MRHDALYDIFARKLYVISTKRPKSTSLQQTQAEIALEMHKHGNSAGRPTQHLVRKTDIFSIQAGVPAKTCSKRML